MARLSTCIFICVCIILISFSCLPTTSCTASKSPQPPFAPPPSNPTTSINCRCGYKPFLDDDGASYQPTNYCCAHYVQQGTGQFHLERALCHIASEPLYKYFRGCCLSQLRAVHCFKEKKKDEKEADENTEDPETAKKEPPSTTNSLEERSAVILPAADTWSLYYRNYFNAPLFHRQTFPQMGQRGLRGG